MTTSTTPRRPVSGRGPKTPLKSPLAMPSAVPSPAGVSAAEGLGATLTGVALTDRGATISEFEDYLRTTNNRAGRPYEEKTIENYAGPCRNLDTWMTANGIDGDFTVLDAATLNRYFRQYYLEHGQGGTHTLQRNLIQLFNFLEHERDFASPYGGDGLNRYAAPKGRPKTLSGDFVDELLEVTGAGRARDFETARDHAMIRILRSEGIWRRPVPQLPACFPGCLVPVVYPQTVPAHHCVHISTTRPPSSRPGSTT